jgi:hypothetical protein
MLLCRVRLVTAMRQRRMSPIEENPDDPVSAKNAATQRVSAGDTASAAIARERKRVVWSAMSAHRG